MAGLDWAAPGIAGYVLEPNLYELTDVPNVYAERKGRHYTKLLSFYCVSPRWTTARSTPDDTSRIRPQPGGAVLIAPMPLMHFVGAKTRAAFFTVEQFTDFEIQGSVIFTSENAAMTTMLAPVCRCSSSVPGRARCTSQP